MATNEDKILKFSTRVRQLILSYQNLKKTNEELHEEIEERDNKIAELERNLSRKQKEYDDLKLTKMIEVTDGDVTKSKKRIADLIREVNQCITLLSEK